MNIDIALNCHKPLICRVRAAGYYSPPRVRGFTAAGLTFGSQKTKYQIVPCGVCASCRANRARSYVERMKFATANGATKGVFLTFTYNDSNLPKSQGENLTLIEGFNKRLREHFDNKLNIEFLQCGEYGGRTGRIHAHAVFTGISFPDVYLLRWDKEKARPIYCSHLLDKLWQFKGHLTVEPLDSIHQIEYVTLYNTKQRKYAPRAEKRALSDLREKVRITKIRYQLKQCSLNELTHARDYYRAQRFAEWQKNSRGLGYMAMLNRDGFLSTATDTFGTYYIPTYFLNSILFGKWSKFATLEQQKNAFKILNQRHLRWYELLASLQKELNTKKNGFQARNALVQAVSEAGLKNQFVYLNNRKVRCFDNQ